MKKRWRQAVCLSAAAAMLGGCSTGRESVVPSAEANKPAQPVTLKILQVQPISDEDFQLLLNEPVTKKYPHISFERMSGKVEELVAAGNVPDLILAPDSVLSQYKDLGLTANLDPLVKEQGIDLSRFDPVYLDVIRAVSGKGELYALPYARNFNALYYNKDLFDRFGIGYPQDGMTWDDAIDLGKKLTRGDGGIQYRGLDPESVSRVARQFALAYVDYKTLKATVNSAEFRTLFDIVKRVYTIPGNEPKDPASSKGEATFTKDKTLAMYGTVNILWKLQEAGNNGLNWDVAQYPAIPGKPNVGNDVDSHTIVVTGTGKNRAASLLVADVLTSPEVQLLSVRKTARVSPLKDAALQQQFGADVGFLKGKRLGSIFKSRSIAAPVREKHHSQAQAIANQSFKEYVLGKDLNTALREAEEKINQLVQTTK
ncbi:ABC transporter substrate-binding protein [Paenibacillus hemerocallicola]|nr:extracellular solute-binding protein [Paenibacillus hemerocallicola]